jgi:hypothetical protein
MSIGLCFRKATNMIPHAKISRLYQYLQDPEFSRVMAMISAATEEGLDSFDLEVQRLDDEMRLDLMDALDVMGYVVVYDNDAMTFDVSLD